MRARRPLPTLVAVAAIVVAASGFAASRELFGREGGAQFSDDGSTLHATFADRNGDGFLERRPGMPFLDRTELAPRVRVGRTIATFAQLTDAHVVDEESPARVEMLDRLGPPFTSAFRPQEALTGQVLAGAVRSLNRERPDAVVVTGDLIDNAQANELDEALAVLRGGRVDPGSGGRAYEGVQQASNPDPFYYRPDVDPPRHAGLLHEAEQPFVSPGLRARWYPVLGNHDVLVQGTIAPTRATRAAATGRLKLVELDSTALALASQRELRRGAIAALLAHGLPGRARRVTPDPRRVELPAARVVARLRTASRAPGHGPLLHYTFDLGRSLRGIVVDAVRRAGGSGGIVRAGELRWLARALRAAGRRWVVVFSHQPLPRDDGGGAALAQLDRDPHVVAAIAGDTHKNSITPRRSPAGGYWLITTSSLVDYPQQARMFRLARTGRGVVLETWLVDHDPASRLGRIARELAYLDSQGGRPQHFAGRRLDQNVRLYR